MANDKRLKTAGNIAVSQRNYRRARDRALARLAKLYPNVYKDLLEEEKLADEQTGKKWDYDTWASGSVRVTTKSGRTKSRRLPRRSTNKRER